MPISMFILVCWLKMLNVIEGKQYYNEQGCLLIIQGIYRELHGGKQATRNVYYHLESCYKCTTIKYRY